MKKVSVKIARPVRVIQNTVKSGNQWGQIKCVATGETLHTGQLPYIKRVAKTRYNSLVDFGG